LTPYARAWQSARLDPGYLDLADSRFHQNGYIHPPESLNQAWQKYLNTRYYEPEAKGPLASRDALVKWYLDRGLRLHPDSIFMTPGTSEAYRLLFTLRLKKNETVALPRPGYPLFEHLAALSDREVEYYDLDSESNWSITPESFKKLSPRVKLIVLITPNNPTGRIYSSLELAHMERYLSSTGAELIIDEVFEAWSHIGAQKPAALAFPYSRVWTLNGLSKRWASPDLKVAWCAACGPPENLDPVLDEIDTALDSTLSLQPFAAGLLPELLKAPDVLADLVQKDLFINRQALAEFQKQLPGLLIGILPDGGIHWMPRTREIDDERLSVELLKQENLHIQPGYLYDVSDQGRIVLSLLKKPEDFSEGLLRLKKYWK